eukprot:14429700-Alexandrium_andersonii.AAC.1
MLLVPQQDVPVPLSHAVTFSLQQPPSGGRAPSSAYGAQLHSWADSVGRRSSPTGFGLGPRKLFRQSP